APVALQPFDLAAQILVIHQGEVSGTICGGEELGADRARAFRDGRLLDLPAVRGRGGVFSLLRLGRRGRWWRRGLSFLPWARLRLPLLGGGLLFPTSPGGDRRAGRLIQRAIEGDDRLQVWAQCFDRHRDTGIVHILQQQARGHRVGCVFVANGLEALVDWNDLPFVLAVGLLDHRDLLLGRRRSEERRVGE